MLPKVRSSDEWSHSSKCCGALKDVDQWSETFDLWGSLTHLCPAVLRSLGAVSTHDRLRRRYRELFVDVVTCITSVDLTPLLTSWRCLSVNHCQTNTREQRLSCVNWQLVYQAPTAAAARVSWCDVWTVCRVIIAFTAVSPSQSEQLASLRSRLSTKWRCSSRWPPALVDPHPRSHSQSADAVPGADYKRYEAYWLTEMRRSSASPKRRTTTDLNRTKANIKCYWYCECDDVTVFYVHDSI